LPKERSPFQSENKNARVFQSYGGHLVQTPYQYRNQAYSISNPFPVRTESPVVLKKKSKKPNNQNQWQEIQGEKGEHQEERSKKLKLRRRT
jgi:hypothetical protein